MVIAKYKTPPHMSCNVRGGLLLELLTQRFSFFSSCFMIFMQMSDFVKQQCLIGYFVKISDRIRLFRKSGSEY